MPLPDVGCVVDVGGGEGTLPAQILGERPGLTGVLLDLPMVIDGARATLERAGLHERCALVAGDILESIPAGGDLYVLVRHCRHAMRSSARQLVLEALLGDEIPPTWRTLVSLGVIAQRGGRTRSETQMRSLLASAGLDMERPGPLPQGGTWAIVAG